MSCWRVICSGSNRSVIWWFDLELLAAGFLISAGERATCDQLPSHCPCFCDPLIFRGRTLLEAFHSMFLTLPKIHCICLHGQKCLQFSGIHWSWPSAHPLSLRLFLLCVPLYVLPFLSLCTISHQGNKLFPVELPLVEGLRTSLKFAEDRRKKGIFRIAHRVI